MIKALMAAGAILILGLLWGSLAATPTQAAEVILHSGNTIEGVREVSRIRNWVKVLGDSMLTEKFPYYFRISEIDWESTLDANQGADPELLEQMQMVAAEAHQLAATESKPDDEGSDR